VGAIPLRPVFQKFLFLPALVLPVTNVFRNIISAAGKWMLHFELRQHSANEINKFLPGSG
jgi:hypothetical protein